MFNFLYRKGGYEFLCSTPHMQSDWFCYLKPFGKTCNEPEEKADEDNFEGNIGYF